MASVNEDTEKMEIYEFLVGMQSGAATLENSLKN